MARKESKRDSDKETRTRFTVRVESHDGSSGDMALERAMVAVGFSRRIAMEDKAFVLPKSEYRLVTDQSRAEVRDLVRQIATKLGVPCSILVTQGRCSWFNLARSEVEKH